MTNTPSLIVDATAFSAALYLLGWGFGDGYYDVYGIGLAQLEISVPSYLIWGLQFLIKTFSQTLYVVIFVILGIGLLFKAQIAKIDYINQPICAFKKLGERTWSRFGHYCWFLPALVFLLLYLYPKSHESGQSLAMRDGNVITTNLPMVRVTFKTPDGADDKHLTKLREQYIDNMNYLYIGQHKGVYYFLHYHAMHPKTKFTTFIVPESSVGAISVLKH